MEKRLKMCPFDSRPIVFCWAIPKYQINLMSHTDVAFISNISGTITFTVEY